QIDRKTTQTILAPFQRLRPRPKDAVRIRKGLMTSPAPSVIPPLLQLQGWGMRRGRRTVLASVDLALDGAGCVVLMGPAGTGKSSLLQAMSGQHSAHGEHWGQLLYQGQPL